MTETTSLTTPATSSNSIWDPDRRTLVYTTCGFIVLLFGVYFPILQNMVHHWSIVEDYQHGFIVAPLAVFFATDGLNHRLRHANIVNVYRTHVRGRLGS